MCCCCPSRKVSNFFQLQGGKTALLNFGLFDQIFFSFTRRGCTCFYGYFSEKKQKQKQNKTIAHANPTNHKDNGFLEDFVAVRPESEVALDLANFAPFFFRTMTKMHKMYPSVSRHDPI